MKKNYLLLINISLLIHILNGTGCLFQLFAQSTPNYWEELTPVLIPRGGAGSAVLNGKIYVAGGVKDIINQSSAYGSVEVYDTETYNWYSVHNMQSSRCFLTLEAVNNKIYAIGGAYATFGAAKNVVEEYDPVTNKWLTKTGMPDSRYAHSSCVVDDKIYVFGGIGGEGTLSTNFVYDPATDEWNSIADLLLRRSHSSCCVFDNKIFLFGGYKRGTLAFERKVDQYDPLTDTWVTITSMPDNRTGQFTFLFENKIYIVGDKAPIRTFDPAEVKWQEMEKIPADYYGSSREIINNNVYIIGGFHISDDASESHAVSDMYRVNLDLVEPLPENTYLNDPFIHAVLTGIHPNPVTGTVKIYYLVTKVSTVQLNIYSLTGQKITSLVNEIREPGAYKAEWNIKGQYPGVYLCLLKSGGNLQTRRIIVLE
ncbi:MAG: T9SS type A sorting domain-containing protein [Bacteroidales bacterium]|nr:MAG: T9SS type A sorting domain-containing protein [Bacteroidales bacterium]